MSIHRDPARFLVIGRIRHTIRLTYLDSEATSTINPLRCPRTFQQTDGVVAKCDEGPVIHELPLE